MEHYVARGMQMAMLSEDDINRIHKVEMRRGRVLAFEDIQEILGCGRIKDFFGIPEDKLDVQAAHALRIKQEIDRHGLTRTEHGFPEVSNLEANHAYDWAILHRGDVINWHCLSSGGGKANLRKQLQV